MKQLSLAALLLAAATMTACSSDNEDIAAEQQSETPTTQKYTMTITATKGDDAATRGLALDGNRLNVKWNEGEVVEVYQLQDSEDVHLGTLSAAASETGSTTLTGTLVVAPISDQSIYFYMNNSYSKSYSDQNGVLLAEDNATKSIEKDYDFAQTFIYSDAFTVSDYQVTVPGGITLQSQQAIVKFMLKDADGYDLNATSLTVEDIAHDMQDGGSHISQSPLVVTPPTGATNVFYVAINGLDIADKHSDIVLTATTASGDIYTYTKEYDEQHPVYFEHGKYYAIQVKMTKPALVDLSMVDCAGNARASRWTANCYMVHTAGDYKLPLVYGNAIKNGQTNAAAYTGITAASSDIPTTLTFPRHDGEAITAPWIKDNGIAVNSAELLWQDAQGLVTAVGIDGDYLTLTVGMDADTQEGNAVIAAKTADGTIVWSWHIWVTKQTFAAADLATVTTTDDTSTGTQGTDWQIYKVTPVNLGWVGAAKSTGYNTYYEWGRKDPFIPGTGTTNGQTDHTVYDINGATVTEGFTYSTEAVSLDGFIKNPTTFYRANNGYNSSLSTAHNLWDAHQTSNSNNIATATVKTVYDPCPAGFCVPTGNLYKFLNTGYNGYFAWVDEVKAIIMQRNSPFVYFPASGNRGRTTEGNLSNVGIYGYYWSASASANSAGHTFYFNYGTKLSRTWGGCYRANGFSVRAVAEETSGESPTTSPETNRSDYGKADPIILY